MKEKAPEIQLGEFIAKFTPEIAERAWESYTKLRKRLSGAVVMVYDKSAAATSDGCESSSKEPSTRR